MIVSIAFLAATGCRHIEIAMICPWLPFWIASKTIRLYLVLLELFYAFTVFAVIFSCS